MRQAPLEKTFTISDLFGFFVKDMDLLEKNMCLEIQNAIPLIPNVSKYIIASGGKRLRPLIAMSAAKLCGYNGDHHIDLATTIEFIHTATLLHDDVVDESVMRRGLESAHQRWGNKASILVGDFLFSRALNIMTRIGTLEMIQKLSHSSMVLAEGEVFQLSSSYSLDLTVDDYFKIIKSKTACLFETAAGLGAMLANADESEIKSLGSYGQNLGMAFQIIDDLLDYSSDISTIGKNAGDDFMEGKVTLPVILCYQKADDTDRKFWEEVYSTDEKTRDDLQHALVLMKKYNIYDDVQKIAMTHAEYAKNSLSKFADGALKQLLLETAVFACQRSF